MHDASAKSAPDIRRRLWLQALRQPSVWKRAAGLGLGVGVLQAVINQGDYWVHRTVNATIIAKTIISPLVTFGVALFSAAGTWVEKNAHLTEPTFELERK